MAIDKNSMDKYFAPYQESFELKELGFDEPCFKCKVIGQEHFDYTPSDYDDFPEQKEKEVLIPTFSQAFDFFREKYNIQSWIPSKIDPVGFVYEYMFCIHQEESSVENYNGFETYEEAELACLRKLIEIVKR